MQFDDGASRSNLLYWIATRPAASPCANCTLLPPGAADNFTQPTNISAHCADHLACFALGLRQAGDCCPQPGGTHMLSCCPVLQ